MPRRDDAPWKPSNLAKAARFGDLVERLTRPLIVRFNKRGFPYLPPTVPRGVEVPPDAATLGADYDTEWARGTIASAVRRGLVEGPVRLAVKAIASPSVHGTDRLSDLARLDEVPPLIFTPNHHSHLDTAVMAIAVPEPWRSKLVVAAAADYFFDKRWKATMAALALNAIPIDREVTGRKSSDMIRDLINDGWSLVIYPEGGRSPDGWGQDFKGGAAYLSSRTGAAVVPVFIDGTGSIFGKGMKRPKRGTTKVVFGQPLRAEDSENTRRFSARIERAVTTLGDESLTDYWSSRQRAARQESPKLSGPEYTGWRRQWALSERRSMGDVGERRRQKRRWPDLGD
ncbi:MAG: 1-acyl-sn-glycerol-3-phosphate acyltransferase [Actinobacteria bacterium]|nr:1-acyl-sn-glycerol-3-phosphate acyltransferase [Actinomycetota bacterium]